MWYARFVATVYRLCRSPAPLQLERIAPALMRICALKVSTITCVNRVITLLTHSLLAQLSHLSSHITHSVEFYHCNFLDDMKNGPVLYKIQSIQMTFFHLSNTTQKLRAVFVCSPSLQVYVDVRPLVSPLMVKVALCM